MSTDQHDTPPQRGRPFTEGNPGRKPGSKNRNTLVREALSEEACDSVVTKILELALAGDRNMLKLLGNRILPGQRLVDVALPRLDCASDAVDAYGAIVDALGNGQITPSESAHYAKVVEGYTRAIRDNDLEVRIANIEKKLNEGQI